MRTFIAILAIFFAPLLHAQDDSMSIKLPLSAQQIQTIKELQKLGMTIQMPDSVTQGKYSGLGKEIGLGVGNALAAVNKEVAAFGESKVGKFTMLIVAWKILGEDVKGFTQAVFGMIIGIPLLIAFNWFLVWFWKRTTTKTRLLVSEEGKKKNYQYEDTWYTKIAADDEDWDNPSRAQVFLLAWWIVFVLGNLLIVGKVIF